MNTTLKIWFSSVICLILFTSYKKEKGFVIKGYITGITDSTQIMLTNISSGEQIDSALVVKGRFTFSGVLDGAPEELRIISGKKEILKGNFFYTDVLMGNETVQLSGDISDMPLNISSSGSPVQQEAERYHKQLYAWNTKLGNLRAHLKSFPNNDSSSEKKEAVATVKAAEDSLEHWKTSFIKNNFNSYIALVMYNYRRDFEVDTLKKLYNRLPAHLKQSKFGRSIHTQINYPKPRVGDNYHNFEALTASGETFKISAIKDAYILLQFAGTGCYWSHISMPEIRKLCKEYKDSVLFVSYFMDNKAQWLHTLKTDSITWLSIWSKGFKYSDACSKYAVTGTPTFFLISPGKKIVSTWFGYEEGIVEKKIKMALSGKQAGPIN